MKNIDEARLESDLAYRFNYLSEFIGFGADDIAAIHGAAEHLAPLVPALVDAVYDRLFSYDATKRQFMPRQSGYEGDVPISLEELSTAHEMIQFRKQHLARYLTKLVSNPYDEKMVVYLDAVGRIHTRAAGSPELHVPLVHMNALLGFVSDALTQTVFGLGLPRETETAAIRAFGKLLWIQNDLINRHYQASA
ncbi:protoglobin family protein [Haliangium sp.]|uniref:protoglobin family protein n=1 Tax=Haliangium sp. TaxID=2663208 RepID=UPI003D10C8F3